MSKNIQRVAKLETGLTPKQAILLWFQEAHGFNTIFEYIHHLKSQPDSAAPIPRLTDQVAEAVNPNPPKDRDGRREDSGRG